jgi:hypothetical protein
VLWCNISKSLQNYRRLKIKCVARHWWCYRGLLQGDDVKKAHRKLALRYHPDKATAVTSRLSAGLGAGVGTQDAAQRTSRISAEADLVFRIVQEAKESLSSDSGRISCRRTLEREAFLFNGGAMLGRLKTCDKEMKWKAVEELMHHDDERQLCALLVTWYGRLGDSV